MLSDRTPVLGCNLDDIRQHIGLNTEDTRWLYGIPMNRWSNYTSTNQKVDCTEIAGRDAPVEPTLGLLVRMLDRHPELSVIPQYPSVEEMFILLRSVKPISQKEFSIMMGKDASAGYRWNKLGHKPSPPLQRLMYYLKTLILAAPINKREAVIDEWIEVVRKEGLARINDDVFKKGCWREHT